MTTTEYERLLAHALWLVPALRDGADRGSNWLAAWDLARAMLDAGIA